MFDKSKSIFISTYLLFNLADRETVMRRIIIIVGLIFCFFLSGINLLVAGDSSPAYSPYYPTHPPLKTQEIIDFVRQGATYLENGGDIQEFNKNPGRFTKGEFLDFRYLVIMDCATKTALAHPFLPQVVNVKGLLNKVKDAKGRATSIELCEATLKNPLGAWIVSFVPKPGEDTIDIVYKYAIRVKNTDIIVGVNARALNIESHIEKRAMEEEQVLNSLLN